MFKVFIFWCVVCGQLFVIQNSFADERHDAGRWWAEKNGIIDPNDCYTQYPGREEDDNSEASLAFIEGCLQFVREEGVKYERNRATDDEMNDDDEEE